MKHVSIIQHTQSEWLGLLEDHLEGRRIRFSYFRPFTPDGNLPPRDLVGDGLILIGSGHWGTVSEPVLPALEEEIAIARTCLMLEMPVIGIGLGAQILGIAAGGTAAAAPLEFRVDMAKSIVPGALGGFLPEAFPSVSYMRDRVELPAHAQSLAVNDDGKTVLFQIGANAFGFSGHPGVKLAMIEDLIMEFEDAPGDVSEKMARLRTLKVDIEDALVPIMTGIVQATGWMRQSVS